MARDMASSAGGTSRFPQTPSPGPLSRTGRFAAALTAVALLTPASLGHAESRAPAALLRLPFPVAGNVTVARLKITSNAARLPRLSLASPSGLPPGSYAVATVGRTAAGKFQATVAIVYPGAPATVGQRRRFVSLQLPSGFSLGGPPRVAPDVLYSNSRPLFALATTGTGSLLGGQPPKLPIVRIVTDAQLLALDRSVPLAEVGLLGLQYVAAQISKTSTTTLPVTIGMSHLSQVNAVELRFPSGMTVVRVSGPAGVDTTLLGNAVQLVASTGFFQEGLAYGFAIELSRPPVKGEYVTLRASQHYFEGRLPFTERFALF